MKKNSLMRYIDSCVSNIARKIQDEFDESKHPRDEGGRFTTAGRESRMAHGVFGGENAKREDPKKGDALNEYATKLIEVGADSKEVHRLNREGDLKGMKKLLEETEKGAGESTNESESPAEVSKRLNWTQHGETLSDDVMFYKTEDGWTFESDYLADEYVDKSFDSIEQAQKYYKKVMSQQTGASSLRNKELDDVDTGASEEQGENQGEDTNTSTPEVAKEKSAVEIDPDVEHTIRSEVEYDLDSIWGDAESIREYVDNAVAHLENTLADTASTDYAADVNYGASKEQVEAVFHKLIDELVEENKSRLEEEENDKGYEEQEKLDEKESSDKMEWSSEELSYFKKLATKKLRASSKETKKFLNEMGVEPEEDSDWGVDQAVREAITKDPDKAWDLYTRILE